MLVAIGVVQVHAYAGRQREASAGRGFPVVITRQQHEVLLDHLVEVDLDSWRIERGHDAQRLPRVRSASARPRMIAAPPAFKVGRRGSANSASAPSAVSTGTDSWTAAERVAPSRGTAAYQRL